MKSGWLNQCGGTHQGGFQVECIRVHEDTARKGGVRQRSDLVPLLETDRLPLIDLTDRFFPPLAGSTWRCTPT
jgi:hypothetical protein